MNESQGREWSEHDRGHDPRSIVVVGPCASGKSTLVTRLRRLGYVARVCAQEHSEIPTLWQHAAADFVILLEIDLTTLRARRGEDWPAPIYEAQMRRLEAVRGAAHLILDAVTLDEQGVFDQALAALQHTRSGAASEARRGLEC